MMMMINDGLLDVLKEESARKAAEAHVTESEAAIAKQKADQEVRSHNYLRP